MVLLQPLPRRRRRADRGWPCAHNCKTCAPTANPLDRGQPGNPRTEAAHRWAQPWTDGGCRAERRFRRRLRRPGAGTFCTLATGAACPWNSPTWRVWRAPAITPSSAFVNCPTEEAALRFCANTADIHTVWTSSTARGARAACYRIPPSSADRRTDGLVLAGHFGIVRPHHRLFRRRGGRTRRGDVRGADRRDRAPA